MKKSILALLLAVLMVASLLPAAALADGTTLTVGANATYKTIGAAVAAASSGDTIYIKNGTYNENVTITGKALTLVGESQDGVVIKFDYETRNTTAIYSGTQCYPIVSSNSDLTLQDLTIAGPTAQHHGIGGVLATAGLTMSNVTVKDIRCTADNAKVCGVQYGRGIMVDGSSDVSITNCKVIDFQKNAIDVNTTGEVVINNNIIEGVGSQAIIAQNGIVARKGDVTITNNEISGLSYTADNEWKYGSVGVYPLEGVTALTITGNTINAVDSAMYVDDVTKTVLAAATIENNTVTNPPAPVSNETQGTIYATIQEAVNKANNNDVILVAPGTYDIGTDNSIDITKKITIKGAGESTVIKGTGAADYGLGLFTFRAGSEGTVLDNFTIEYTATGVQRAAVMFYNGFKGSETETTTIKNVNFVGADELSNDIKAIGISSVYFDGPGNVEISGCTLTNFAYGMYFNSFNNLYIHDNVINGTKYNAINVAGDKDDYPSDNIRIVDNTLINISYANYDYDEYSSGIRVGVNVTGTIVKDNNISMLNGKTPIYYDPDTSANPVRFIVKYVSNGVVIELNAVDAANSTISLNGAPYNPGYAFLGWNDGVTTYSELAQYTVTKDTTFTAVWVRHPDTEYVPEPEQPVEPETPVFPFYDVPTSAWYYTAVKYVYDNKLMDGVDTYVFAPNDTLTRAMVWTIIARMSGVDTTGGNTWYAKAQEWVITNGISDGENPTAAITRQELVTMLYRYAQIKGYDVSVGESTNILSYVDATSISEYAVAAFQWACGSGLTEGDENGALTPLATATRAQAAAMIMRFLSK